MQLLYILSQRTISARNRQFTLHGFVPIEEGMVILLQCSKRQGDGKVVARVNLYQYPTFPSCNWWASSKQKFWTLYTMFTPEENGFLLLSCTVFEFVMYFLQVQQQPYKSTYSIRVPRQVVRKSRMKDNTQCGNYISRHRRNFNVPLDSLLLLIVLIMPPLFQLKYITYYCLSVCSEVGPTIITNVNH